MSERVQKGIDQGRRRFFRALSVSTVGGGALWASVTGAAASAPVAELPLTARTQPLSEHQQKYYRTARL